MGEAAAESLPKLREIEKMLDLEPLRHNLLWHINVRYLRQKPLHLPCQLSSPDGQG